VDVIVRHPSDVLRNFDQVSINLSFFSLCHNLILMTIADDTQQRREFSEGGGSQSPLR
jgi:hypothetical protein